MVAIVFSASDFFVTRSEFMSLFISLITASVHSILPATILPAHRDGFKRVEL